ncbi:MULTISPECIES: ABC transporter permease [Serratia]|uniref:ABC transporter permease n=1 Tax=Serratia TaxID=613 RepID=UPI001C447265|nr:MULTISPECIES: ABC transporter permease [Serratia]QXN61105.1 ABC transporter permease [Serratia fonticola]UAN55643.1 ABC transporter permease [Serratia sp. JSRIV004]CAI0725325.1 Autoinducer 2 import system permease protein lsrD [Serratia fonticola]
MSKTTQRDHTERWLVALLVLVAGVFSVLIPQVFWSAANFQSIASQIPVVGILTLAMAITMLTGGINLSIIATANASALVMAWVCTHLEPTFSSLIVMLLAGGAVALVVGIINGVLISVVRVSPILATLGIMTLLKGINVLISKGSAISNFPSYVLALDRSYFLGVPVPLYLFAVVALLLWLMLAKTPLGRQIYLSGSNEKATFYSGINTRRTLIWVYVISSLLCAVAALLMMSKLNSAKASYGESLLLITILATVLGGVNPDGGFGRVFGIVLALFLLQMLESGLNIMGVSSYITMALWGSLLLAFIFVKGAKVLALRFLGQNKPL